MKNLFVVRGFAALGLLLVGSLPFSLAACGEKCDPGYHLEHDICYVDTASASAGAAGAPSCDDPSVSTFGAPCHSAVDCVCDSDFCPAPPGTVGACTRSGCDKDPSVCPDGYSCVDLSGFGAGLPFICVPP
jgi:hypothetical protein